MKKFNIDQKEAKRILLMHKALIKEQSQPAATDPEQIIDNFIKIGCLKGGVKKKSKSTGKVFYRKDLKSGNISRQFSDMTFTISDANGKVLKTAKWNCDKYVSTTQNNEAQIALFKKDGWKTKDELAGIPDSQLEDKSMYEKNTDYGTALYRRITDINTPSQYDQRQIDTIKSYEEYQYYPKAEFPTGSDISCRDLSKEHPGIFKTKVEVCIDRSLGGKPPKYHKGGTTTTGSGGSDSGSGAATNTDTEKSGEVSSKGYAQKRKNQQIDKGWCRDLSKEYYLAWKNQDQLSDADFTAMKNDMQTCVNQHNFGGGIFRKSDNYVRIMTGSESGQGPGADPDSKGRVWLLGKRRR